MAKNNLDDLRFRASDADLAYKATYTTDKSRPLTSRERIARDRAYNRSLRANKMLHDAEREELKARRGSVARVIFATVICMLLALYFIRSVVGVGTPDFSFTRLLSGLAEWTNSINLAVQPVKWNLPNWLQWLNDFANLIWLPLGYGANFISALISFVVYVFQFFLFS